MQSQASQTLPFSRFQLEDTLRYHVLLAKPESLTWPGGLHRDYKAGQIYDLALNLPAKERSLRWELHSQPAKLGRLAPFRSPFCSPPFCRAWTTFARSIGRSLRLPCCDGAAGVECATAVEASTAEALPSDRCSMKAAVNGLPSHTWNLHQTPASCIVKTFSEIVVPTSRAVHCRGNTCKAFLCWSVTVVIYKMRQPLRTKNSGEPLDLDKLCAL